MKSSVKGHPQDRRAAERVALSIVGITLDGAWCGLGRIADISANGARVEGGVPLPEIGHRVRLGFLLSLCAPGVDVQRFEVQGSVARHTQTRGFAIRFDETDAALAEVIHTLVRYGAELASHGADLLDFEKIGDCDQLRKPRKDGSSSLAPKG